MSAGKNIAFDSSEPLIAKALEFAATAHAGQIDKGGLPYLWHPISVANQMKSTDDIVVALLHDVCEDSDITIEGLEKAGFSEPITSAIQAITKVKGEDYYVYLNRVKQNQLATNVKIADMRHNSDLSRIGAVTEKDLMRQEKYAQAINLLLSVE